MSAPKILSLSAIQGQVPAVDALTLLAEAGGPIPPLLLHGPDGIGKRSTALAFAAGLVCGARAGHDACGRCSACLRIAGADAVTDLRARATAQDSPKTYPDAGLISVAGRKTRISVLQARDVALSLAMTPFELDRRIYIIDPAHRMTVAAANSLLKTLEEPPDFAVLILITSAPWDLPITVRSRLRPIRFRPLGPDVIQQLLEGEGVSASDAEARARRSAGSLERARDLDVEGERLAVTAWVEVLERLVEPRRAAPLAALVSEQLAESPDSARSALDLLLGILRDVALADSERPPIYLDEEQLARLAPRAAHLLGPGDASPRMVDRLRREIDVFNRNPRLAVEGAVLAAAGILSSNDLIGG